IYSLAALLPLLPWCRRFELRAQLTVQGRTGTFVLASGDPILPGPPPRGEASALERAFVRDCARAGDAWTVVHEPAPVQLGEAVVFPDFALRQRRSGRAVLVELAGFWPQEYLAKKVQLLAAAENLLLCVPARRAAELPAHPRLLPFTRRVDVGAVLVAAAALLRA
ncbi:MAG TPA: DUF790 family protein, partial [Planctomycetota bacterium]|nr:DUF790 family protein [Planctomycetota bacterium]